jgi:hypothetical protein
VRHPWIGVNDALREQKATCRNEDFRPDGRATKGRPKGLTAEDDADGGAVLIEIAEAIQTVGVSF